MLLFLLLVSSLSLPLPPCFPLPLSPRGGQTLVGHESPSDSLPLSSSYRSKLSKLSSLLEGRTEKEVREMCKRMGVDYNDLKKVVRSGEIIEEKTAPGKRRRSPSSPLLSPLLAVIEALKTISRAALMIFIVVAIADYLLSDCRNVRKALERIGKDLGGGRRRRRKYRA